jgi:hypothetical protein
MPRTYFHLPLIEMLFYPCPFQGFDEQPAKSCRRQFLKRVYDGPCNCTAEEDGRPVKFELKDQTRQAVDDHLKASRKKPGHYRLRDATEPRACNRGAWRRTHGAVRQRTPASKTWRRMSLYERGHGD